MAERAVRSWEALCEDIRRAEPGSPLYYQLISNAKELIREGTMGKHQRDADEAGWLAIYQGTTGSHHGGFLHSGDAKVKGNSGVGRKGKGQVPVTAKEIRAAKKVVAAERKAAAREMKAKGKK